MKTTLAAAAFAAFLPLQLLSLSTTTPVQAQTVSQAQEGDYYAPGNTVVQQPTPQELNQAKDGDYYTPSNTTVQQPTPQELYRARQGDYYAPNRN